MIVFDGRYYNRWYENDYIKQIWSCRTTHPIHQIVSVGPLSEVKGSMNVTVLKDNHGIIGHAHSSVHSCSREKRGETATDWHWQSGTREEGRVESVGQAWLSSSSLSLPSSPPQRQGTKRVERTMEARESKKSFCVCLRIKSSPTLITMHFYYTLPCKQKKKGYVGKRNTNKCFPFGALLFEGK